MEVFYVVRLPTNSAFYVVPGTIIVFQNTVCNVVHLQQCYHCNTSTILLQPVLIPVNVVFYAVPVHVHVLRC